MPQNQDNMLRFLRISGDYTSWNVYKKAVIVCDVTEMFIRKAFASPTRTIDQMRQAARSCKQNIVEGTGDATVSMEMCIKLIGIAKASARELLEDYRDYLRQNNLEIWSAADARVAQTRKYCLNHDEPHEFVCKCSERSLESVANIMLTQIHQLDSMLAQVLKKIETEFLREGGLKEAMSRSRRSQRGY